MFQVDRGLCSSQKCPYVSAELWGFFFLKGQEYSTFSRNLWFNPSRSDVATTQLKLSFLIERENKKKRGFATTAKLLSNTSGSNSWELVV